MFGLPPLAPHDHRQQEEEEAEGKPERNAAPPKTCEAAEAAWSIKAETPDDAFSVWQKSGFQGFRGWKDT